MGLTIYYTSMRSVTSEEADAVRAAANLANRGHSWLSSEAVHFFPGLSKGMLLGGSKPNFQPDPNDERDAHRSGLPDGRPRDVIEILSRISREHAIDWQLMHDFGPLGEIRDGVPSPGLVEQVEAIAGLRDAMDDLDLEGDDLP
ncbi:MAG TPA: hypothetical protein VH475_14255 [Tepidisphaeraceae bacterium]|jgi:hypothetical protein